MLGSRGGGGLNERDMVQVKHEKPRGVLHARSADGLRRYWPSADLAPFIEHYWIVRWDVAEPVTAETLPHPSVHMVLGHGPPEIVGVMRGRFTTTLAGAGRVIGTKFRPGAFRAFLDRPVSSLSNRRTPLRDVFGAASSGFAAAALAEEDDVRSIAIIESFLRSRQPVFDASIELARTIAARIAEERELTRVEQVAELCAMNVRQLQRLFREYVGVTPKWVIQRYRLIEAAERLSAGAGELAALAHELGYADQAHFIRDFKRIVGQTPAQYVRGLR
jgi:AraC-like DNA-binding protein